MKILMPLFFLIFCFGSFSEAKKTPAIQNLLKRISPDEGMVVFNYDKIGLKKILSHTKPSEYPDFESFMQNWGGGYHPKCVFYFRPQEKKELLKAYHYYRNGYAAFVGPPGRYRFTHMKCRWQTYEGYYKKIFHFDYPVKVIANQISYIGDFRHLSLPIHNASILIKYGYYDYKRFYESLKSQGISWVSQVKYHPEKYFSFGELPTKQDSFLKILAEYPMDEYLRRTKVRKKLRPSRRASKKAMPPKYKVNHKTEAIHQFDVSYVRPDEENFCELVKNQIQKYQSRSAQEDSQQAIANKDFHLIGSCSKDCQPQLLGETEELNYSKTLPIKYVLGTSTMKICGVESLVTFPH